MSNFYIRVKTEELLSKAEIVKKRVTMMQSELSEAERLMNNTASYWLGSAGDKKRKDFYKQKKEADVIIKRLSEYPEDLLEMAGIYDQSEKTNVANHTTLPTDVLF
jgi:uncharacterized protein YukE